MGLARWLSKNTSVTALNLNENNLGDEGAKEVAAALEVNRTVTMLAISSNSIDDKELRKKCRSRNDGSKFEVPCTAPNAEWRKTKVEELLPVDFDKVTPPEPRL